MMKTHQMMSRNSYIMKQILVQNSIEILSRRKTTGVALSSVLCYKLCFSWYFMLLMQMKCTLETSASSSSKQLKVVIINTTKNSTNSNQTFLKWINTLDKRMISLIHHICIGHCWFSMWFLCCVQWLIYDFSLQIQQSRIQSRPIKHSVTLFATNASLLKEEICSIVKTAGFAMSCMTIIVALLMFAFAKRILSILYCLWFMGLLSSSPSQLL